MRYVFSLFIIKISRVNLSEQKCVSNKSIISCDDFVVDFCDDTIIDLYFPSKFSFDNSRNTLISRYWQL